MNLTYYSVTWTNIAASAKIKGILCSGRYLKIPTHVKKKKTTTKKQKYLYLLLYISSKAEFDCKFSLVLINSY